MQSFRNDPEAVARAEQPRAAVFFTQAARRIVAAGVSGALVLTLAACGRAETTTTTSASATSGDETQATEVASDDATATAVLEGAADFEIDPTDLFSKRDLDPSYSASDAVSVELADSGTKAGAGVEVDGSTVTITAAGTYVLSGTLADGRIVVDVADTDKVQLVLDGAQVTSSTATALYVRSADKVFLTLADGSKNVLAATGEDGEEDHNLDGAVYACDDLTVNGAGALTVTSEAGHGVVAKDELTLVSGTLEVTAAGHAIQAKDSLAVKDGSYKLSSGQDGVHVEHDSNGEKGFAYIVGGTFDISAGTDGFDTSQDLRVDGGSFAIAAGDDGMHSEYDLIINDGTIRVTESYEALEGARIEVNGGDIDVVASDDGLNAAGDPDGSTTDDMPGDFGGGRGGFGGPRGMQGDAADGAAGGAADGAGDGQTPPDGEMPEPPDGDFDPGNGQAPAGERPEMPEGAEPGDMTPPDGATEGEPPARPEGDEQGGAQGGGQGGGWGHMRGDRMGAGDGAGNMRMGGGGFDADDTASITISGGKLVVDAGGDGIDSNGALLVTGGEVYVNGPTSDGDGALDTGTDATITGGIVIAVGSSGMAETFGSDSTQGSMLVSATGSAGDKIELKDASGTVLASFTPTKSYACVVASAPGVEEGGTYTLSYGSESTEVTLDSISYRNVTGGMGGGMGGPRGTNA